MSDDAGVDQVEVLSVQRKLAEAIVRRDEETRKAKQLQHDAFVTKGMAEHHERMARYIQNDINDLLGL